MRVSRWASPFEWFCLVMGLWLLHRYLWILDDAFVYFRYVNNLLFLRRGLVFNEAEYVEGFSSPIWMLLMIVVRSTRLDYWFLTHALAVVSFVTFWWLAIRLQRQVAPESSPVNVPLAIVSFAYGPLCYFSSGIETPLVQIAALLFALWVFSPHSRSLTLLLAVTPLVRHEFALPLALCVAWFFLRERRVPWRLIVATAGFVGAYLLFRVWYYADFFPNTYYLKNDVNPGPGWIYVRQTVMTYGVALGLALGGALLGLWRGSEGSRRLSERGLLLLCVLGIVAYVIKIGGDPRHYRFLAFPFVLFTCAMVGLPERWLSGLPRGRQWLPQLSGVVLAAAAMSAVPPQLDRHPLREGVVHERSEKIGDAHWHRVHPQMKFDERRSREDRKRRELYTKIAGPGPVLYRNCTLCLPAFQDPNARFVHRFGLTEAILAHADAKANRPAHKYALVPRAKELMDVLNESTLVDAGVFRRAVAAGTAPDWIAENLDTVELVAAKSYNDHHLGKNVALAFRGWERIRLPEVVEEESP